MIDCDLNPGPHPLPSPAGRGVINPFSLREKGGDEGNIRSWLPRKASLTLTLGNCSLRCTTSRIPAVVSPREREFTMMATRT